MKDKTLRRITQKLVLISLGLVILQTPVVVLLWSRFPAQSLIFKSVADAVIIVSFALAIYLGLINRNKFNNRQDKIILGLCVIYLLWHSVASLLSWGQWQSLFAGLAIDLRFILIFVATFILARLDNLWWQKINKVLVTLGLIVGVFALLQVTVLPVDFLKHFGYSTETITPYKVIDQNPDYIRINSTMRGPNPLGAFAIITLALSLGYFYKQNKLKGTDFANFCLIILSLVMLFFSHSRSAWLAGGLVMLGLLIVWFKKSKKLVLGTIFLSTLVVLSGLAVLLVKYDTASLIDKFQHLFLHDNSSTTNISSDDERQESIMTAVNLIKKKPIIGYGVGSAGSASIMRSDKKEIIIENQFLLVAYETGLVGLMIFLSIYGWILAQLWRLRENWASVSLLLSGVGLGIIGLLLPVFVDSAVAVTWFGLSGAMIGALGYNKNHGTTHHQKAKINS